jgi:endonuclease/exonuclease/phosphatase (EEP) superfamily protein YafD
LRSQLRNRQLAALAQVAREHTWPLVVIGDLNITPFSPLFARTLRAGKLASCDGGGLHPTWPARVAPLFIQIDHCLASAGIQTEDFRVGPYLGSDHYPISVKVGSRGGL